MTGLHQTIRLTLETLSPSAENVTPEFPLAEHFTNPGKSSPENLLEIILIDQQLRWNAGQPLSAESYVSRFRSIELETSDLLDVVYQEYLLCEANGLQPDVADWMKRFPDVASDLDAQVTFHLALEDMYTEDIERPQNGSEESNSARTALPTIGRFRPLRRLGPGGMGIVFVALDEDLDREVAIKIPCEDVMCGTGVRDRFLREAKALAAIQHPHICPIYDFGEHEGRPFIVMPLLSGQTLAAHLGQRGKLPVEEAVEIVSVVASAVEFVHRQKIIHRDLKPGNIMLDSSGTPMVLDFGLVITSIADGKRLTHEGSIAGTPAYMAPERMTDPQQHDGIAADVYSLGVILYECLTGSLPHDGANTAELLARALTQAPVPPCELTDGIPGYVEQVCMRALAKSPEDRFASMGEFSSALQSNASKQNGTARHWLSSRRRLTLVGVLLASVATVSLLSQIGSLASLRSETILNKGDVFSGTFEFHPDGPSGDVDLVIEDVTGTNFVGNYQTEHGEYVWEVEGTLIERQLNFKLVRARSSAAAATGATQEAAVSGRLADNKFDGEYRDHDSQATIALARKSL